MDLFDVVLVVSWVLVVVTFCIAASILMGADWRDMWASLKRRQMARKGIYGRE